MSQDGALALGAKLREVGRHSIVYGFGSVAQSAVGLILLPVLTGALSREAFGAYSMILMAGTVCSAVFYFGMTSALPRSYFDHHDEGTRRAVFTTGFILLSMGALMQMLLGVLAGDAIALFLMRDTQYAEAVAWGLGSAAIAFVNQYFFVYLRMLRKSLASVLFSLVGLAGGVGLTLLLLHATPGSVAAPFQAIAWSQAVIAGAFVTLYGRKAFTPQLEPREIGLLLHFGLASVLASFGNMLLDWTDRIIIERHLGLGEVGIYSAAFRVGTLVNILMITPFVQIWSPMMLEYRNRTNIRELFTLVFSYFFVAGAVVIIGGALFAHELLGLVVRSGPDGRLVPVFVLALTGTLLYGTTNIVAAGLFYERKVLQVPLVYYGAAAMKAGVNLAVIPLFGIVAAAAANLLTCALVPAGIHALAKRYFAFEIEWPRIGIIALNCAPPLAYALFVAQDHPLPWAVRVIWLAAAVVAIAYTCFPRGEREAALRAVRGLRAALAGSRPSVTPPAA